MTFRLVCAVKNNQIIVTLPPNFGDKKEVTVVVDDFVDTKAKKIELLRNATKDALFLADIKEINQDFDSIDHENL